MTRIESLSPTRRGGIFIVAACALSLVAPGLLFAGEEDDKSASRDRPSKSESPGGEAASIPSGPDAEPSTNAGSDERDAGESTSQDPSLKRDDSGGEAASIPSGPDAEPSTNAGSDERDAGEEEARALLEHIDDLFRGESSIATMRMEIRTERWERSLRMRAWSEGTDKALVRILAPPRERGTATLRVEGDLWNYLPNVDRTIKVPAGMMSASWMGSHFTNDDLVQETRFSDDYDFAITSRPDEEPAGVWVIEMTPKPRAPVVWGKVVTEIRDEVRLPNSTRFYDERGRLMRTMSYHDERDIDDRRIPTRIRLTPEDKPNEYTEMIYEKISFDVDIPAATFTMQALRR